MKRGSGIPHPTRRAVRERDQDRCVRCGDPAPSGEGSIHHRRPRAMGGTRDPKIHALSNLVLLCGTGTTGCHGWIESNRVEARDLGWLISKFEAADTHTIPLRWADQPQRTWLHDDGSKTTEIPTTKESLA